MMLWKGEVALDKIQHHLAVSLEAACVHLKEKVRAKISRPGRRRFAAKGAPTRRTIGNITAKKLKRSLKGRMSWRATLNREYGKPRSTGPTMGRYRMIEKFPRGDIGITITSRPGEPPRKQTGTLLRSYQHKVNRAILEGRVGTDVFYAPFLEKGTKRMAARPHLRATVIEEIPNISAILGRPVTLV